MPVKIIPGRPIVELTIPSAGKIEVQETLAGVGSFEMRRIKEGETFASDTDTTPFTADMLATFAASITSTFFAAPKATRAKRGSKTPAPATVPPRAGQTKAEKKAEKEAAEKPNGAAKPALEGSIPSVAESINASV